MPAHDVIVTGEFTINTYVAVFKIGEEFIDTVHVVYGAPISAPDAPLKEGHTFAGWQNVPEVMPAHDLEILGSYTVNSYKLLYKVDGVDYKEVSVDYGTAIVAEPLPEKEGHTFSGWTGLPEVMPAHDVIVTGEFTINTYVAVFKIGEEFIDTVHVVYGAPISAPDAPLKEGHTFAGWQNVPEVMPAHDLEILGSYTVNSYKLLYKVDGVDYKEVSVDYGTVIVPESHPEKEGHTFSGWTGLPEVMPAHDVIVTGEFNINSYILRIYLNDELYYSEIKEYGSAIVIEDPVVPEGMKFDGWIGEIPEAMPAHDVDIYGTYSVINSIDSIILDDVRVTVYTLDGHVLYRNEIWHVVKAKLKTGIYIINGVKYFVHS